MAPSSTLARRILLKKHLLRLPSPTISLHLPPHQSIHLPLHLTVAANTLVRIFAPLHLLSSYSINYPSGFYCPICLKLNVWFLYSVDPLSDDEGSLEVFLTPDSDYSSSPRELDLLPPSHPLSYIHTLAQPDVLCSGSRVRPGSELTDSDFVLPSRQIELLRITEKKTALCVRTSSLEAPPTPSVTTPNPSTSNVWACPVPARSLSEDSGRKQNSSHCRNSTHRSCYSTVRIYPQYHTGLPKETSVKVRHKYKTNGVLACYVFK